MKTLLLPPGFSDDSVQLWRAAIARGWAVERLRGWQVPDALIGCEVAIYGESFFAAHVAQQLQLALIAPSLDWLTHLPGEFLGRRVGYMTLAEARTQPGIRFWKPADDKLFPARVYDAASLLPAAGELPDTTPVLWSDPVHWTLEYRCFVLENRILTLSPYWRDGELAQAPDGSWPAADGEREEAAAFGARVLASAVAEAPEAFVLDIGQIEGWGWAVIEANPAWAAGLYGCDPALVLEVVAHSTQSRWNAG